MVKQGLGNKGSGFCLPPKAQQTPYKKRTGSKIGSLGAGIESDFRLQERFAFEKEG